MSATYISAELRRLVSFRAEHLCEYCLIDEDDTFFGCHVDHIISEKHGGLTIAPNLAYACTPSTPTRRMAVTAPKISLIGRWRSFGSSMAAVSKWDIFHYVYALLHHPAYREKYAENLKRELPRIPFMKDEGGGMKDERTAFEEFVRIGRELAQLHLNYESAPEYPLRWVENPAVPFSWRVEKMKLSADKSSLVVNASLTLEGIPPEALTYKLGNRSALEWIVDQYQVKTDARSGLTSDPNRDGDEEYIVCLVGRVVTVSVETQKLVAALPGL